MRIGLLSTSDIKGGAARAAYRLHTALLGEGQDSWLLVADRFSQDPTVIKTVNVPFRRFARRFFWYRQLPPHLWREWPYRPPGFGLFSDYRYRWARHLPEHLAGYDLINLHWVSQFLDYPSFFAQVAGRLPMVWTLHDMNPFTGGCHVDYGCGKFRDSCQACPQLGARRLDDPAHDGWRGKYQAFSTLQPGQLHLVSPSRWLAGQARESSLMGRFPISVIPNGLDLQVFKPHDRQEARRRLGLPPHSKIVLFVANALNGRHKGFSFLIDALKSLQDIDGLLLVTVGKGQIHAGLPYSTHPLGMVNDDGRMAMIYSAADIFAAPFLQDNLPNTVMESLACGTPVIGFKAGGIPDLVDHGTSGLLVKSADPQALALAARQLFESTDLRLEMGANSRRQAVQKYSLSAQASSYTALFEQLIAGNPRHPAASLTG